MLKKRFSVLENKDGASINSYTVNPDDVVEYDGDEIVAIYQVGKVNKNGVPVSRESKAIEDIMNSSQYNGAPIYFIPYNSDIEPIIYMY